MRWCNSWRIFKAATAAEGRPPAMKVRPFDGCIVSPALAAEVVTPAYDAMLPEERARFAESHPLNYVNAMRSPEEFPAGRAPPPAQLLAGNRAQLVKLLGKNAFHAIGGRCFFIYRLRVGEHTQTGVVAQVAIDEYAAGAIKLHEDITREKERQLTRYLDAVGAVSSPVCLAYAGDDALDRCVGRLSESEPLLDFDIGDGVRQSIWKVDGGDVRHLHRLLGAVRTAYLTDGHHRCAAGLRYAEQRRAAGGGEGEGNDESAGHNWLLVAFFPQNQLRVLSYHRCVRDLNGLSLGQFLAKVGENFTLGDADPADPLPKKRGEFALFVDRRWYALNIKAPPPPDPVEQLDVRMLEQKLLAPVLGITSPRDDPRLGYVAGVSGAAGIAERCRRDWRLGIACHPVSLAQIMAVADAGKMMPPKSTWFDPKMRSGIFLTRCNRPAASANPDHWSE